MGAAGEQLTHSPQYTALLSIGGRRWGSSRTL